MRGDPLRRAKRPCDPRRRRGTARHAHDRHPDSADQVGRSRPAGLRHRLARRTATYDRCGSGQALAGGGGNPAEEVLLRHRLGEQVALADADAEALQLVALVRGLDAFADRLEAEPPRQLDDRLEQAFLDLVTMAVGDVGAIDLELAERQLAQPRQRRISGAEVVDRQAAALTAQLVRDLLRHREIVDDLILGDFEDETGPRIRGRAFLAHDACDRQLDEGARRYVHRKLKVRHADRGAVAPVAQRRGDDAFGQYVQVGVGRTGQEGAGREHAELGMTHPDQRFAADPVAGLQADLGLVPDLEPVALERSGKRDLRPAGGVALLVVRGRAGRREHPLQRLQHDALSSPRPPGRAPRESRRARLSSSSAMYFRLAHGGKTALHGKRGGKTGA